MGLPKSPVDKLRKYPPNTYLTEAEILLENIQLFSKLYRFVEYGAAIFFITIKQDQNMRCLDSLSCKKVLLDMEKARYLTGTLVQTFSYFAESYYNIQKQEKRKREMETHTKEPETQTELVEKMMQKKFDKLQKLKQVQTHESKLDIHALTGNLDIKYTKGRKIDTNIRLLSKNHNINYKIEILYDGEPDWLHNFREQYPQTNFQCRAGAHDGLSQGEVTQPGPCECIEYH
jgi:hypothetical protein